MGELQALLRRGPGLDASLLPLTSNMAVAMELDRLGIEFIDEWDYLDASDIETHWELAHQLADDWWPESVPEPKVSGISLAAAARQEWVHPIEACLNASTIFRRVLESFPVEEVLGYVSRPTPLIRTGPPPLTEATTSLATAVFRWHCDQVGIPFKPQAVGARLLVDQVDGFQLGQARRDPRAFQALVPGPKNAEGLLILDNGLNRRETVALVDMLNVTQRWNAVALTELTEAGWLWPTSVPEPLMAHLDAARIAHLEDMTGHASPYPEIFANPYLRYQFEAIWDEMRKAAEAGALLEGVLDVFRPVAVCLGHEAFTRETVLVQMAQSAGIPVVSLVHSGLRTVTGDRGVVGRADRLLVWGHEDVRRLTAVGVRPDRLRAIGSLQHASRYVGPQQASPRLARSSPGDRRKIVFLTSSVNSGYAEPLADPRAHRQTWLELLDLVREQPAMEFVIKPHPSYDHRDLYRLLAREAPGNLVLAETDDLRSTLVNASVCVLVNYMTTAALEAMLAGVPVVYLQTAEYEGLGRQHPFSEYYPTVTSVPALQKEIIALGAHAAERERYRDLADHVLDEVLGPREASPVTGLAIQLEDAAKHAGRAASGATTAPARRSLAQALIFGATATSTAQLRKQLHELHRANSSNLGRDAHSHTANDEAAWLAALARRAGRRRTLSFYRFLFAWVVFARARPLRNRRLQRMVLGDLVRRIRVLALLQSRIERTRWRAQSARHTYVS